MRRASKIDRNPIGKRYGRLVVTGYIPGENKRSPRVIATCDCGKVGHETWLYPLRNGIVKSCGCLKRELCIARSTIHAGCGLPEYTVWKGMKQRCNDSSSDNFRWYGGIGVSVCRRWEMSFANFMKDMGRRPFDNMELDRINPFGNYEPGNCRWVTHKENMNNQRQHHA